MNKRNSMRMSMVLGKQILQPNVIEKILKFLDNDKDHVSLYSWTLVSHSWCQFANSLLWSRPFACLNPIENQGRGHLLIQTYLSCLDDKERQILIEEGLDLPSKSALFDYPVFLKELHIGMLQGALAQWWAKNTTYRIKKKANFQTLETTVSELLFNRCNGLRSLDCELQSRYNIANYASFTGIRKAVCQLNELKINCGSLDHSGYLSSLLTVIIESSQHIRHIVVTPYHDGPISNQIPRLIESQINLEQFSMVSSLAGLFDPHRSASIFSSLTSQTHSLVHADLRKVYIDANSLQILARCNKLRSLHFVCCQQEQDITLSDSLVKSCQLPITKLVINNEETQEKHSLSNITVTSIVMMAAETLVELVMDSASPELVEIISTKIPHLNSLAIRTTPPLLFQFLSSSTIEHLALSDVNSNLFSITVLQQIGRLLPTTLTHLQLECRYNVAPESMTGLLDECRAPLKILSLDVEKFDDTLLERIADYARETGKRLKELRIGRDTRIQYDEELCKKLTTVIPSINQNYKDPWPILIERRDPLWKNLLQVQLD
ncbi:13381_t:CDS:2 [Acaulospora morrowiae]|uniref:13381_t:CDS:1 n=1 Tax=Acaulospora morrowiae TaxID=94023 RepID=A0A9N9C7K7_9GLOM|nr:13381_t:CDS:2 [Acaulospora morrowiae]